jgi:hypothetical protein
MLVFPSVELRLLARHGVAGIHVFGTGHTAAHCAVSKWPSHSVHFFGSITYISFLSEIAAFGHSNSQAPHTVHWDATIL